MPSPPGPKQPPSEPPGLSCPEQPRQRNGGYRPRKQKGHTWSIFQSVANCSAGCFISSPPPNGHLPWRPAGWPRPRPQCPAAGAPRSAGQGGDGRMAAQFVQTASAVRANAARRDAQPCADLSSWPGWLLDEQANELLALRRQFGESHAQRAVPLGAEHVRRHHPGARHRSICSTKPSPGSVRSRCGTQHPAAFLPGGGGDPADQLGRIRPQRQLIYQPQPDHLANVVGCWAAELIPAADSPDKRREQLDQPIPRALVTAAGSGQQSIHRVALPRVRAHHGSPLPGWWRDTTRAGGYTGPARMIQGSVRRTSQSIRRST